MSEEELPKGWAWATIADLAGRSGVFVDGDWVESKDQDPDGDVRLIQLADVGEGQYLDKSNRALTSTKAAELRCTYLNPGDVLVARMPDPLGRACIFPGDPKPAVTVVDVCIIRSGGIDHRWMMWAINSPASRLAIAGHQSGSTRKRISRSNLGTIPIPVPPLPEQVRIAAAVEQHLSDIDAGVRGIERSLVNLRRYRASVLKAACEGRLVPTEAELARREKRDYEPADVLLRRILKERRAYWEADQLAKMKAKGQSPKDDTWKAKYEEPDLAEASGLPRIPAGWQWSTLDCLLTLLRNGTSTVPKPDGKVRVLRISAVRPMSVNVDDVRYLPGIPEDYRDDHVLEGDILITRYNGSSELVGVCGVVQNLCQPTAHPDKLIKVRVLTGHASPKLLAIMMSGGISRSFIQARFRTTAGQVGISGGDLKKVPIPLPPLAEQHRIVAEVDRLLSIADETEQTLRAQLARAARLRQAVLKRAFEGKLVPQDPNDEPASALLARLRAQEPPEPKRAVRGRPRRSARASEP